MSKERKQHTPRLRKETVRKLDSRTLEPSDLANVVGGWACQPRYTTWCGGCPG